MLFLLCELFIVLCCLNETGKNTSDLKILSCINYDGKMIDTKTTTNKCNYRIKFYKTNGLLEFGIYISNETISGLLHVNNQSVELIRCTETISKGNLDDGIVVTWPDFNRGISNKKTILDFSDDFSQPLFLTLYQCRLHEICEKSDRYYTEEKCECCGVSFCNKRIIYHFRKTLGILGKGIDTAAFKFRFVLQTINRFGQIMGIMTAETRPFGFIEKDESTLVFKEVKPKYCHRLLDIEQ
ncbi:hypothetical protein CDIK_2623 [Cucumispora dikerogammari]|nr:hypothetical protein CDIK_2623 [Cucumispora dikerogammari]